MTGRNYNNLRVWPGWGLRFVKLIKDISEIFGDTFQLVSKELPSKERGTGEWQRGGTGG